ncbi:hypothetical protein EXIGLDRAFT_836362 [Exidia glandulosa HHB12029]|uniref:VWFA domain-containing protein n=1 Tax=Exidia glandulosa HHB12029 TaxID=1314781 RepID=A0A165HWP8_EXIGL|nr:hypothetical protein EXIGLDRAFT_836362 [Exidia glandulosa HHB12029]
MPNSKNITTLEHYDTVFLLDDSNRMLNELADAKAAVTTLAAEVKSNTFKGGEPSLRFFNSEMVVSNVGNVEPNILARLYSENTLDGAAYLGQALKKVLDNYFNTLHEALKESATRFDSVKGLNVIVISNGNFADKPSKIVNTILPTIQQLKRFTRPSLESLERHIGIQLVQLGDDKMGADAMRKLDEETKLNDSEDIFDTTQWDSDPNVKWDSKSAKATLRKILLGALAERLDD